MEATYFDTFFDLRISIINDKEFYFNDIKFNSNADLVLHLKKVSNSYSEYILKESLKLDTENKTLYLKQKIKRLKTLSNSINSLYDSIKDPTNLKLVTPFASIQVNIKSKNKANAFKLFCEIFLQVKTISIKVLFDIRNQMETSSQNQNTLQQQKTKRNAKPQETLSNLITHKNSIEIVENIKVQYKNIKGKRLKLLLLALQDLNLLPNERVAQKFYDCCKREFEWDIASYTAMNGYEYNSHTDNSEFAKMKQHFEAFIKTK